MQSKTFKPMLAASLDGVDLSTLKYPLMLSPKIDGIRCMVIDGAAYSRNMKLIRNKFIQAWAKGLDGLDGELVVGSPTDPFCMNNTQSGVMSAEGEPDFTFYAFDSISDAADAATPFEERLYLLDYCDDERVKTVPHYEVVDEADLLIHEQEFLELGYEGVMLRAPQGQYKQGRSTLREGGLMKLKRFMDGEAVVIAVEEAMENQNEATLDELGRTKRSTHKENLVGKGMVGTIIVKDPKWGEMRLSPGVMSHTAREYWWVHQNAFIGELIHWRAFGYGVKDKPRFPRFYGFRAEGV